MTELNDVLLDEKLGQLEKVRVWSPRVISKFEAMIRGADDYSLFRINALQYAQEKGVAESEAIDLFLYAAKIGLFEMQWQLICPVCGHVVESVPSLRHVHSHFHCNTCFAETTATLDDTIQVTFTISPSVRDILFNHPEPVLSLDLTVKNHWPRGIISDPSGLPLDQLWITYTRFFGYISPEETRVVEFEAVKGTLHLFSDIHINTVGPFFLVGEPAGSELQRLEFRLSAGKFIPVNRILAPLTLQQNDRTFKIDESGQISEGPVCVAVTNDMERPRPLWVANLPLDKAPQRLAFPPFLSGKRLLTHQTFRDLFRSENTVTEMLDLKDITYLFTDLKGSTELYDQIGDAQAYFLVRQHFDMLEKEVAACSGAIVKTIGDAIMASFMTPLDATRAAVAMLKQIHEFNRNISAELILKIGVHRGHSLAVTLNDRIDYFGQNVNIASRVQSLAHGNEICLTEDAYGFPGVADLLQGLQVSVEQVALRGVTETMKVYRVESR